jgi:hypothetical protein
MERRRVDALEATAKPRRLALQSTMLDHKHGAPSLRFGSCYSIAGTALLTSACHRRGELKTQGLARHFGAPASNSQDHDFISDSTATRRD